MDKTQEFDVTVESGIISIFQRQNFKLDRVFSEFVDNSLQSFLDHKEELKNLPNSSKCIVDITWDANHILIKDNAFGMNEEEFGRALKLKAHNPNAWRIDQLSVYGMGLKYAAVYLGNHYSITSSAYNSTTRYFAEIDVPVFEQTNPKTVSAKLSDDFEESHFTEINITSVRIKRTIDKENDLRRKLGTIYNHYISKGLLTIRINNIPVNYVRPELRPKDDGGMYFEKFEDSFTVADKKYEYSGWVGVLNEGDQSITGINLVQANRCIELGYKPEAIFGKGNSFQNSRVIGEIVFSGENYVLSFNKDTFVWADDGAEDAFIASLLKNTSFSYIIKMAKALKFGDDDEKIIQKTKNTLKKNISNIVVTDKKQEKNDKQQDKSKDTSTKTVSKPIVDTPKNEPKPVSKPVPKDPVNISNDQLENNTEYDKMIISVEKTPVNLYVDILNGDQTDEWIKFEKYEDGYLLHINYCNKKISSIFPNQTARVASNSMAIMIASSMIKAQKNGLKLSDSKILLDALNDLMGDSSDE